MTTYAIAPNNGEAQELLVAREDVMSAVEKAMVRSLRDLVKSVDREFALPEERAEQPASQR